MILLPNSSYKAECSISMVPCDQGAKTSNKGQRKISILMKLRVLRIEQKRILQRWRSGLERTVWCLNPSRHR